MRFTAQFGFKYTEIISLFAISLVVSLINADRSDVSFSFFEHTLNQFFKLTTIYSAFYSNWDTSSKIGKHFSRLEYLLYYIGKLFTNQIFEKSSLVHVYVYIWRWTSVQRVCYLLFQGMFQLSWNFFIRTIFFTLTAFYTLCYCVKQPFILLFR